MRPKNHNQILFSGIGRSHNIIFLVLAYLLEMIVTKEIYVRMILLGRSEEGMQQENSVKMKIN